MIMDGWLAWLALPPPPLPTNSAVGMMFFSRRSRSRRVDDMMMMMMMPSFCLCHSLYSVSLLCVMGCRIVETKRECFFLFYRPNEEYYTNSRRTRRRYSSINLTISTLSIPFHPSNPSFPSVKTFHPKPQFCPDISTALE
jgi:hypothetical protein